MRFFGILALSLAGCFTVDPAHAIIKCGPECAAGSTACCPDGQSCQNGYCQGASSTPGPEDGGGVIIPPGADLYGMTCAPSTQIGCPEGQKCTTRDTVSAACDPAGPVKRGALCAFQPGGADNCTAGTVCDDAGGGIRICRKFCTVDADCGTGSFCTLPLGRFRACTEPCQPTSFNGCAQGLSCYPDPYGRPDCYPTGSGQYLSMCTASSDCLPRYACGKPQIQNFQVVCRGICRRGMASDCPGPQKCYDMLDPDGNTWSAYGVCA